MVEEEPEYGDAQLMTWNPHVGRSPTGWDDYARRERERFNSITGFTYDRQAIERWSAGHPQRRRGLAAPNPH